MQSNNLEKSIFIVRVHCNQKKNTDTSRTFFIKSYCCNCTQLHYKIYFALFYV